MNIINKIKTLFEKAPSEVQVLGVDFSHGFVRVCELQHRGTQWVLSKYASRALQDDGADSIESDKYRSSCLTALREILKESNFETDKCAVSLPITSAVVKVVRIPLLKEEELAAAVENGSLWESSIQLAGDLNDYSVFWQVVKRDEARNEMSLLFVGSKKSDISEITDFLRQVGLDALIVDVRCFALRNIIRTRTKSGNNSQGQQAQALVTAFLEISAFENYLVFVDGDLPFIYDIFLSEEDSLLIRNGGHLQNDLVLTRLSDQIRAATSTFMSQSGRKSIDAIEFASSLPNARSLLDRLKKSIPGYKLELLDPFEDLEVPANLRPKVLAERNPSSAGISIGLASRTVDIKGYFKFVTAVSNINLLPNREEKFEEHKNKTIVTDVLKRVSVVLLLMGGVLAIFSSSLYLGGSEREQVAEMQEKFRIESERKVELESAAQAIRSFAGGRHARNSRALSLELVDFLPKDVFVLAMTLNKTGPSELYLSARDLTALNAAVGVLGKVPYISSARLDNVEREIGAQGGVMQKGRVTVNFK